jgi:hypothetical protein
VRELTCDFVDEVALFVVTANGEAAAEDDEPLPLGEERRPSWG